MSSSGLDGCCPMAGGETSLGSCFDDYKILNGMMILRHDDMMT